MSVDTTNLSILGVPPYIFFSGLGFVAAFIAFNLLVLNYRIPQKKANIFLLVSIPVFLAGAKTIGICYNLLECIRYGKEITGNTFLKAPIVFYGGMLSFLTCHILFSRKYEMNERKKYLDVVTITVPLFHIFGRLGCFFSGCCYGIEKKMLFSVYYTSYTMKGPESCWRVPIQLICSLLNLILLSILLILLLRKKCRGRLMLVYLFVYSVTRIVIECFRGEWDRSLIFGVSCSQVISFVVLVVVIIKILTLRRSHSCLTEKK